MPLPAVLCGCRYPQPASDNGWCCQGVPGHPGKHGTSYRASRDDYENSVLPSGYPACTLREALDCACRLYLGDTTAWIPPPPSTN